MLGHPNPKTTQKKRNKAIKFPKNKKWLAISQPFLQASLGFHVLSRLSITGSTRARQRPRKSPGWKCRRCHRPGHKPPGSGRLHPVASWFLGISLEELLEIYRWKDVGKKSLISSNIEHRTVFLKYESMMSFWNNIIIRARSAHYSCHL